MVKKYLSSAANLNENGDRELFGYTRRKRIGMPCRWFNLCVNLKRYKKRKQNKSKAKGEKAEKQRDVPANKEVGRTRSWASVN